MKILSLNVWGGMLHAPLLDYLVAVDADVYCLQEVPRAVAARSEWLTYRDGTVELQQRANLYREIANALPGHDGFFAPAMRGELMADDEEGAEKDAKKAAPKKKAAAKAEAAEGEEAAPKKKAPAKKKTAEGDAE